MFDPPPRLQTEDVEGQDIVIAQRVNAYEGLGLWRRWNTPWRKTVYENDDDVFNITHENVAAYSAYKTGSELREAVKRYCDTAALITVSTPHLGDLHREMSSDARVPVEVLPNYINSWVLDLEHDDRQGRKRIGWMGGASHVRDIEEAASQASSSSHWEQFSGMQWVRGPSYTVQYLICSRWGKWPENRSMRTFANAS